MAAANAATRTTVTPPAKFSAWSAVPRAIGVAAGEVGASVADLTNAARVMRDTPASQLRQGLPIDAFSSELGQSVRSYWDEFKPDPNTASTAEQVLFGFSRGLAKIVPATIAAGPAGAIAAGVEEAMTVSDELRRKGVGVDARTKAGIVQGAGLGAAALPLLGRTLAETAALYVAGGPGGFMAQQALTRKILEDAGHESLAAGYDPFDPIGLAVASLIPAGFTAWGLRGQAKAAKAAAAADAAKAAEDFRAGDVPSQRTAIADAAAQTADTLRMPREVVDAAMVQNITFPESAGVRVLPEAAAIADDLRSMARGAGWAQEGGQIMRDVPRNLDQATMDPAEARWIHHQGEVIGRTKWIPGQQWYGDMRAELGRAGLSNPAEIQAAIEKAVAGEPLKAAEARTVDWMRAEVQRMQDAMWRLDDADATARDAFDAGLSRADAADVELTSRAAEIDPDGVERAAMQYENDDAAFMAAMRRIVDGQEAAGQPTAAVRPTQDAGSGARPGGEEAGTAQGATADPVARLNEPAGAAPKPAADPVMSTVAARVADLEQTAPDLVVRMTDDGKPVTLAQELAEVRRLAAEGSDTELGALDADLLRVAAECALSTGG